MPRRLTDRHFSPPVDFLFHESLLFISIPLRRNVSARISLRGMRRLIWVDTLRRSHNVGFLAERLNCLAVKTIFFRKVVISNIYTLNAGSFGSYTWGHLCWKINKTEHLADRRNVSLCVSVALNWVLSNNVTNFL